MKVTADSQKKGDVSMKRKFKILGLSIAAAAILALVIAGTVGAANNDPGIGAQTRNQGEECLCGQCPCDECDPVTHSYNYDYSYSSPGPHGQQNGECGCGDCEPGNHAYSHDYTYRPPARQDFQNRK